MFNQPQKWIFILCLSCAGAAEQSNVPKNVRVDLNDTLTPSALVDATRKNVDIHGTVHQADAKTVLVRVTTSSGSQTEKSVPVLKGTFSCHYPSDFAGAQTLAAGSLFIDATTDGQFDPSRPDAYQAEAMLLVYDSGQHVAPNLPTGLLDGFRDATGHVDSASTQWAAQKSAINLFMQSRAALITKVGKSNFDLDNAKDCRQFQQDVSMYGFKYRDRDWSTPLNHRVMPTFWLASRPHWFGASNDHFVINGKSKSYPPYTFTNDFADLLITYLLRPSAGPGRDPNVEMICNEGVENLLALQQHDTIHQRETDPPELDAENAGTFHYGEFEDGQFMIRGKGWFNDPHHNDYAHGGVFDGRSMWAMGLAIQRDPNGKLAPRIRDAIRASIGFCLRDAKSLGYAKVTPRGNVYWRDVGEQGYFVLGMTAACSVSPEMLVTNPAGDGNIPLRDACTQSLNALVDLEKSSDSQWSVYPDIDGIAVAALASGAKDLPKQPDSAGWLKVAVAVADAWLNAGEHVTDYPAPMVHFGPRVERDRMTLNWHALSQHEPDENRIVFYMSGHWMQGLARLYVLTGNERYRDRCEAMLSYLCGKNPWHARLFNELGGVYNWVSDSDGDGVEDSLHNDMYPESTAFCQIGISYLAQALAGNIGPK